MVNGMTAQGPTFCHNITIKMHKYRPSPGFGSNLQALASAPGLLDGITILKQAELTRTYKHLVI